MRLLWRSTVEYALSRSMSPTMVSSYRTALPDKALLQQRLRQITDLVLEDAEASGLPSDGDD